MSQMMNPMELIQAICSNKNPEQMALSMLQAQAKNNPMLANMLSLVQHNDINGLEQVVRNCAKQRGIDFDKQFSAFRKMIGR